MSNTKWIYSKKVKEHFFHPKNVLDREPKKGEFNGYGKVGGMKCGDIMEVWLKVDPPSRKASEGKSKNLLGKSIIREMKWKTFGCASAIASTSVLSEMVKGKTIKQALAIKPKDIVKELGGLPAFKVHCSVLGDRALESAVKNYLSKKR